MPGTRINNKMNRDLKDGQTLRKRPRDKWLRIQLKGR